MTKKKKATPKGTAGENVVEKWYTGRGYRVFRARPSKRPIWRAGRIAFWITQSNDIFGVFDGESVIPDAPHEYWQACQSSGVRARRRKIEAELIPYWNLGLLNMSYVVRIIEIKPDSFRVHTWQGNRDWTVNVAPR